MRRPESSQVVLAVVVTERVAAVLAEAKKVKVMENMVAAAAGKEPAVMVTLGWAMVRVRAA